MENYKRLKIKTVAVNGWMKNVKASFAIAGALLLCIVLPGCNKDDGETSGKIACQGDVYTVSIGEISKNDAGKIWVELVGDMPGVLNIVQGRVVPILGMKVFVDGRAIDFENFGIKSGLYSYGFNTGKNPEKIIVYSNDGSNQTLTFHGKRKTVIK